MYVFKGEEGDTFAEGIRIKIRIVVNIRVDGFSSIRREGPCFEG